MAGGGFQLPPVRTSVGADTAPFIGGMAAATASLTRFSGGLAAAGAGLVLFAGAKGLESATRAFADFDEKLTHSAAIMGDLSSKTMNDLRRSAVEVSRTTLKTANDAAESYFFLASAGLDAKQSIAALPQVAKFAQAGMFDMATATSLAVDAQSALGLKVKDAEQNLKNLTRVTDVLVRANQMANANVQQFSEALTNKLAARMRMLNIPLEEGVGALAALAEAGIKGKRAGQGLTIVLRDLASGAVRNSKAFESLGIHVYDVDGNFRNIADIVADFEKALGTMSDQEKATAFEMLHMNRRATDFLNVLIGASDRVRKFTRGLYDAGGATEEVAQKQVKDLNDQLTLLAHQADAAKIAIGGLIAPTVTNDVSAIKIVLSNLTDEINRLVDAESRKPKDGKVGALSWLEAALAATPLGQIAEARRQLTLLDQKIIEHDAKMREIAKATAPDPWTTASGERNYFLGIAANDPARKVISARAAEEKKQHDANMKAAADLSAARMRSLEEEWNLTSRALDAEKEKLRLLELQGAAEEDIAASAKRIVDLENQRRKESANWHLAGAIDPNAPLGHVDTLKGVKIVVTQDQINEAIGAMTGLNLGGTADSAAKLAHVLSDPSPWGKTIDAIERGMVPALDQLAGSLHLGTGALSNFLDAVLTLVGSKLSGKGGFLGFLGKAAGAFAGGFAGGGDIPPGQFGVVHPNEMIMTGPAKVIPISSARSAAPITVNVDARGATDPAAVDAAARRAVVEAAPALLGAASRKTVADLRRPRYA